MERRWRNSTPARKSRARRYAMGVYLNGARKEPIRLCRLNYSATIAVLETPRSAIWFWVRPAASGENGPIRTR